VVAAVAHHSGGQDLLRVPEGLGDDVLDRPKAAVATSAEQAPSPSPVRCGAFGRRATVARIRSAGLGLTLTPSPSLTLEARLLSHADHDAIRSRRRGAEMAPEEQRDDWLVGWFG
jgi:hypothetical protein